jgi:hypothetical protein
MTTTSTRQYPYPSLTREARSTTMARLRADIREDALAIRALKAKRRSAQAPGQWLEASKLAKLRLTTRARLLALGFLRGWEWARMENNHPEGDDRVRKALDAIWEQITPRGTLGDEFKGGVWDE